MGLILSVDNVVDFLKQNNICPSDYKTTGTIDNKESRNFNLVVQSSEHKSFLVKQNRVDSQGKTSGCLIAEWLTQQLLDRFSELKSIQPLISEVLLFDKPNSILVSTFYERYIGLDDYYQIHHNYPPQIAQTIGSNLAQIHRASYQNSQYREFLSQYLKLDGASKPPRFIRNLNSLSPSVFSKVCPDGLTFYKLYQRFPSFNRAIAELYRNVRPACLTHNDLTLDNFIVDTQLDFNAGEIEIAPEQVKIIDWELIYWADPAADLGMLVSQYLSEWLNSLVTDPNLDLDISLKLASCPLEKIVPSLKALLNGYLSHFPQILEDRPDFVRRIVQYAGIGIISRLTYYVEYHYPFDNEAICKLQVAKNLLCYPEKGIVTIFGASESELIAANRSKALT